jgi:hypothetical protein
MAVRKMPDKPVPTLMWPVSVGLLELCYSNSGKYLTISVAKYNLIGYKSINFVIPGAALDSSSVLLRGAVIQAFCQLGRARGLLSTNRHNSPK